MVNMAVINLKIVIRRIVKIFAILCIIIFMISKIINVFLNKNYILEIREKFSFNYRKMLEKTIIIFGYTDTNKTKKESNLKKMLVSEITIFGADEQEMMEKENREEIIEFSEEIKTEDIKNEDINKTNIVDSEKKENEETIINMEEVPLVLSTQILETNNVTEKFTNTYGSVKIKNESKYSLTSEMVTPNVDFKNKKDIIVYHTHTCESYTPTQTNFYQSSGNFRTTDLNYNVARVGKELITLLQQKGFNAMQNNSYHDYPAYSGSYTRSLATILETLDKNKNTQFVIDLHRDALGNNSNYAPSVQIGDEICAQLMFVIGTDGGGLKHPNWLNNFKLAIKIQEKANQMYPGLFRPIILRNSRYNQHVTTGAFIIEVGATGNTLEQCNNSMKYLANVISEIMK